MISPTKQATSDKEQYLNSKEEGIALLLRAFVMFTLVSKVGWICGFISYYIIIAIYEKLVELTTGLKALTTMDLVFMYDKPNSISNIVGNILLINSSFRCICYEEIQCRKS